MVALPDAPRCNVTGIMERRCRPAACPGTDGISKCSSAVFEFAVPSWINYRADSYTTAKAHTWRMRNIKGGIRMRGGEGKELRIYYVRRCTCVVVAHARSLRLSLPASLFVPCFIVSARMHRYRRTPIVSLFFSRPPFALSCLSLRVLSSFSFFFFYFPTIIILSNFAHSKRWRKFVEVTPREMRRIPNKAGLYICYEVNAPRINATVAV